jgi:hypothetical protein
MFSSTSRYAVCPDHIHQASDGSRIPHKARRFLPQPARLPGRRLATVTQGERLDTLTARSLGNPQLFWRIADANGALDPFALVSVPGRRLRVPVPQAAEAMPSLEG